jgi:hypothetical protein
LMGFDGEGWGFWVVSYGWDGMGRFARIQGRSCDALS